MELKVVYNSQDCYHGNNLCWYRFCSQTARVRDEQKDVEVKQEYFDKGSDLISLHVNRQKGVLHGTKITEVALTPRLYINNFYTVKAPLNDS